MDRNTRLACKVIPSERGAEPARATTPTGPVVQEASGRAAPNRTYQDLLATPADENLFEHYATSRIAIVSADGGSARLIGDAGIHLSVRPSPDSRYLLVTTSHRPFSYVVPVDRFPQRIEVWDLDGRMVKRVTDRALIEEMSIARDATVPGPRDADCVRMPPRRSSGQKLSMTATLAHGRASRPTRDACGPFAEVAHTLFELATHRRCRVASDRLALGRRMVRPVASACGGPSGAATGQSPVRLAPSRTYGRRSFVTVPGLWYLDLLTRATEVRYLTGAGASADGDRPFLIASSCDSKTTRLGGRRRRITVVVTGSTPCAPGDHAPDRSPRRRTIFCAISRQPCHGAYGVSRTPAPQFAGITRELIKYKRADGGTSLPRSFARGTIARAAPAIPVLAYPRISRLPPRPRRCAAHPTLVRPQGASALFLLTRLRRAHDPGCRLSAKGRGA